MVEASDIKVFLKYLATVKVFSYYNSRNTNMYEYVVNKHTSLTDVTQQSVAI